MKNLISNLLSILISLFILGTITFVIFASAWLYSVSETLGAIAGIVVISICAFPAAKTITLNHLQFPIKTNGDQKYGCE